MKKNAKTPISDQRGLKVVVRTGEHKKSLTDAWNTFRSEFNMVYCKQNPNASPADVMRAGMDEWRNIFEEVMMAGEQVSSTTLEEKAGQTKLDYDESKATSSKDESGGGAGTHKQNRKKAWFAFLSEFRTVHRTKHPHAKLKDVMKAGGKAWSRMTEEEKAPYLGEVAGQKNLDCDGTKATSDKDSEKCNFEGAELGSSKRARRRSKPEVHRRGQPMLSDKLLLKYPTVQDAKTTVTMVTEKIKATSNEDSEMFLLEGADMTKTTGDKGACSTRGRSEPEVHKRGQPMTSDKLLSIKYTSLQDSKNAATMDSGKNKSSADEEPHS